MIRANQGMKTPASILKETFGYDTFRALQQEVIENVLARRDTLAVMPTGGGKSLCYQIPSLLFEGLSVVVSPLISLMKDQVEQLHAFGVPALFLNSSLGQQEYQQNMSAIQHGEAKLLYVAPETLLSPRILSLLSKVKVDLLTIDEAHCISEWGHDFRPEYRQLAAIRQQFPEAVCLALTATATARVRQDIRSTLKFATTNEFVASFNRENLYIEVLRKQDPLAQTLQMLERYKDQSGIIYCFSRKQVDDLAASLTRKGYLAKPYHAGLEDSERRKNQEAFIRDDVQIIVATIAFGMGINKPNVRFVIHYDLPKSIEGYYQEIGRAGRDGLTAHCLLLYSYSDVAKISYFIDQKDGEEKRVAIQHLSAIVSYAEDELTCRRKPLLEYFGEAYAAGNCSNCDNCTSTPAELTDITVFAQKFLSCVKRADERFGSAHIVDILLGSHSEKVLKWGHDKLSTYGIGTELTKKQWTHLARQLVQGCYLNDQGEYHTLRLTTKAVDALKNRAKIMGIVQEPVEGARKGKKQKVELEYNHALFAILREKRKAMADEAGVPPYVIFSDRTLAEMCAHYPQNAASLLNISGVGKVKLAQYGEAFLEVIRPFCEKHGLEERPHPRAGVRATPPGQLGFPSAPLAGAQNTPEIGERTRTVAEEYNAGETILELMSQYQVSLATVLEHLTRYALAGNALRQGADLEPLSSSTAEQKQTAFGAFDELGATYLKPIYDKLGGTLAYDELKILRTLYLVARKE